MYYSDYSSQPDIHIVGIGVDVWTTPAWKKAGDVVLPDGIYKAANDMLYTFEQSKVTAPASLGWIEYMKLKRIDE